MSKWRKRPIVVDAFRWTGGPDQTEDPVWIVDEIKADNVWFVASGTPAVRMQIMTRDGVLTAWPGDWIIKSVNGEMYPCRPDIFDATYDQVYLCDLEKVEG
jgi:hypothetical protein